MIKMISSANFKSSDAKSNFPSDSGEPETDDFAALLDGMSFVIPPVVQLPVNTPTSFSAEAPGENVVNLQSCDSFGKGAAPLPQFGDSMISPETFGQTIPKELASGASENLFAKTAGVSAVAGEGELKSGSVSSKSFDLKPEIPPVKTDGQTSIEIATPAPKLSATQAALAAQSSPNQFAAKKDVQNVETGGEKNSSVNPAKNLFDQIESVQTENTSTEIGKSPSKISENQLRQEMFGGGGERGETTNKLPKLFREVSSFFEVSNTAMKNQPQVMETTAPVQAEGADVAAQIEPQIAQMIAAAIRTEKPQILKMRLNPAELGGVEIKIEKNADGKITAHFNTEKEETRKILTENLPQLRDSLQESGWQIERVEVSCSSFSFGGSEAHENSSQANENAARSSFANANEAGGSASTKEDLNSEKSDRLLSVRA